MSERTSTRRSPERTEREPVNIEWDRLIEEALTMTGSLGSSYCRFYNYSFANQVLLYMQGVSEPVATYKRWADMGRQVKRGSKAKAILRPLVFKAKDEAGQDEQRIGGFKMVNCLFTVSETEGKELPPVVPRDWNPDLALEALDIKEEPFQLLDGNTAGYSHDRSIAISPVAPYPLKTMFHELAHVVLGHTDKDQHAEYVNHRGLKEFQAEATAYLCMNELDRLEDLNASESRAYIQSWLRGQKPDDQAIKLVFTTVDKILKAGRGDRE